MSSYLNFENTARDQQTFLIEQKTFEALKEGSVHHLQTTMPHSLPPWAPQLTWIEILKQLAKTRNTQTLFHLGKKVAEDILFPQGIQNIQDALASMDTVYHDYHLKKEKNIGHYRFIPVDDQGAKIVCSTPYPCEFDRGIIESICQRFKSKEIEFVIVEHLNDFPCREKGSKSCTYSISWISAYKESQRFEKVTIVPPCFHLN